MTLRDSCNVRRLSILAGARSAAAVGREQGLYLRLGALTSLITLLSSSSSSSTRIFSPTTPTNGSHDRRSQEEYPPPHPPT